ncbi:MAG: FkbM family methyltransferase [Bacteroidia bacterium]|nr:FkbM family methyltransferase [Bacteroidia bacterium]
MKKLIKKGSLIVDIGANTGFYTTIFSLFTGSEGKVIAFEPESENFSHLRKKNFRYANVEIHKMAVGEKTEKKYLYLSDKYNVDHRLYPDKNNKRRVEVSVVALDDFLKDKIPDFIKMDIQGYEYFALLGMKNILSNAKSLCLFFEFWPYGLKKSGSDPEQLLNLLRESGFTIYYLDGSDLKTTDDENFKKILNDYAEENYTNLVGIKGNQYKL